MVPTGSGGGEKGGGDVRYDGFHRASGQEQAVRGLAAAPHQLRHGNEGDDVHSVDYIIKDKIRQDNIGTSNSNINSSSVGDGILCNVIILY